jgi:hypothetical protein
VSPDEVLSKYDIPKFTLAALAEVSPQDLSIVLRDGHIAEYKKARVLQASRELEAIFERLERMGRATGVYLHIRTKDIESIRNFTKWIQQNPEPPEPVEVALEQSQS